MITTLDDFYLVRYFSRNGRPLKFVNVITRKHHRRHIRAINSATRVTGVIARAEKLHLPAFR